MKSYIRVLAVFALVLASCSKEEEVITPPAPNKYTITITAEAGGSVSSQGGTYNEGSKITITATPDGQYLFDKWSDGSTVNPREITVTANLTLSATFVKKTYPLSVTVEGEGTVQEEVIIQGSTSQTEHKAGTTVRLTATPNEGWVFAGWSGDVESEEKVIEVAIEKGTSVSALFKRSSFELNITIVGEGTVTEEVIVQPSQYDFETVVRLTAVPAEGWEFDNWSGDIESTDNPFETTMLGAKNITATFKFIGYTITKSTIYIPIAEFPSINAIANTIRDISGGFVMDYQGSQYYIRPGVTENEDTNSIYESTPSPLIILKNNDSHWELLKVDHSINTWAIRNYKVIDNIITLGDGNEIGTPGVTIPFWEGDVWQGIMNSPGEINWTRVTNDQNRSYHHGVTAGDLNGDGLIDIGTGPGYSSLNNPTKTNIWINNGDGTYNWELDLMPEDAINPFALEFADVYGDPRDEIIIGGNDEGTNVPNHIYVYTIDDSTNKYRLLSENSDNNQLWPYGMMDTKVSAFDFNNDGIKDLIDYGADFPTLSEGFGIWIGNGDGSYSPYFSTFIENNMLSSSEFEVFDANNDGFLDVLLRPNGYNSLFRINTTEYRTDITNGIKLNHLIWLNDGTGRFNNYNTVPLILADDVEGGTFHPKFALPYMVDNELHYLAVEATNRFPNSDFEYTIFDIRIFFNN